MNAAQLPQIATRVRLFLAHRAGDTDLARPFDATITYGDLADRLDPNRQYWVPPRYRGIGQILGQISVDEHAHGRPLLSALVVQKGVGRAGPGFAEMARGLGYTIPDDGETAFWREQVEAVVRHWRGKDPEADSSDLDHARAYLAQAMDNLRRAQALIG